jgi:hypothetical protein
MTVLARSSKNLSAARRRHYISYQEKEILEGHCWHRRQILASVCFRDSVTMRDPHMQDLASVCFRDSVTMRDPHMRDLVLCVLHCSYSVVPYINFTTIFRIFRSLLTSVSSKWIIHSRYIAFSAIPQHFFFRKSTSSLLIVQYNRVSL